MRALFVVFLILPLAAVADEVRIAVGMSRIESVALIQKHSGTDITSGLEVVGPKGEYPLAGCFWEFKDYDAIIELSVRDGTVVHIAYWTKKDFGESKFHRAKTEQSITALKLDTKTRTISIVNNRPGGHRQKR